MKHVSAAAAIAVALLTAGAANAAPTPTAQNAKIPAYAAPVVADANAMRAADDVHHTNLRQQLQDKLAKAGYTSIKIMPSSFYIQAKDKKGEPVAMVIGPDSFTEVTEVKATAQNTQPKPQASAQQNATQK